MKALVFDTSSIISLATNNLLWVFKPLKDKFRGEFIIPEEVKREVVETPLKTKRFKFEAMQVRMQIMENILKVQEDGGFYAETTKLCEVANSIFSANGRNITIVHSGEVAVLVVAKKYSSTCVIDERTIRLLVENPEKLLDILTSKFHVEVSINKENLKHFQEEIGDIKIIRSVELGVMAYELGLMDKYVEKGGARGTRYTLLSGILWALKLKGCSISVDEIDEILALEGLI